MTLLGNRIEREICKNLPKLLIKTHGREISTPFLFRVSIFFPPVFFSLVPFVFFKATHTLNAFASSNNGEFCEKAKQGWLF
jgi:hypothetical protein